MRKNFGKIEDILDLPNLVDVQLDSFEDFLQQSVPPEKREKKGLEDVFREVFPVEDAHKRYTLEYVKYTIGSPRLSSEEALERRTTYSAPLKATFRLVIRGSGEKPREIIEQDVTLCDFPLMTERGTFVINGVERVIVNQLRRAPGMYVGEKIHPSGKRLLQAEIIPYRGPWIELSTDMNDVLHINLDKRHTFLITTLFKALGYIKTEDILSLFFEKEKVPRAKAVGRVLAHDLVDKKSGIVFCRAGTQLAEDDIPNTVDKVTVLKGKSFYLILNTLEKDKTRTQQEALQKIYYLLRGTMPGNAEIANRWFLDTYFHRAHYDLSRIGRYKIQKRLGIKSDSLTLTQDDLVAIARYVCGLSGGEGTIDDIDHIANRHLRRAGELLSDQMRVALSRVAWSVRERMILRAQASLTPRDLINTRIVSNILMSFFLTSQLSQFMEQINPLAELTHLRRVSRLGPGGLTRETAGLEVRDVHYSHYGRICPIETPEGPNIGIISSLASYARVNEYGFIETPYRKVENGRVKAKIQYLTADEEDIYTIAQANAPVDKNGKFLEKRVLSRKGEDFPVVPPGEVEYMDISPRQLVSISTALIPFLEHDDANRALMGSNMQRQAVPLLFPEAPLVGTGIEAKVASDSASVITVRRNGRVMAVTGELVVIEPDEESIIPDIYRLVKFSRTNQDTCVNQYPIVRAGDYVHKGDVIIDGAATDKGELALGRNILVAFMPWRGYNFEDAIVISERLLKDDAFTSIHIEEFDADVRDTKLGPEEITREIPNVSEELLKDLDENGIIRVGAEVGTDDILVGKVSPKGEAELTPEEKLIRAIFGEKATDVKDTSLRVPPGVTGVVQDVIVLSRKSDDPIYKEEVERRVKKIKEGASYELKKIKEGAQRRIKKLIVGKRALAPVKTKKGEVVVKKKGYIPANIPVEKLSLDASKFCDAKILETLKTIYKNLHKAEESVKEKAKREIERALSGDDVPQGVLKIVRVFLAERRTISVGDKLSGRHGNKGTVAKIVPEEDMPYLPDGTPIDMALNPLGVPSRMNVGQILETSLGWAAKKLGISVACPVFEGATIEEIKRLLKEADLPENGKTILYDGKTGKPFENEITVGYIYMMKLAHMVSDKIHARSIGSYSLITQQPLGGKAQFGGQRFGEMEVWALEAYGAAYTLQEMLTVKSDDVPGRKKLYECIVKGENLPEPGLPASFNVLLKELNGLCLEPSLIKQ